MESEIFRRGLAWHTYNNLETDFVNALRYVALDKANKETWSESIAQQLLLVGSTLDSVFNEMRESSQIQASKGVAHLKEKRDPNIGDYREVFEDVYELSGIELIAHYGLTNYGSIKPFEAFHSNETPIWWKAYNVVKHEFFQNMRSGTLDNLVNALGGLFALNVTHKDSQPYLIDSGVIFGLAGTQRFTGSDIWNWLKISLIGIPHNVASDVWAQSPVFQHKFRRDKSKEIDSSF